MRLSQQVSHGKRTLLFWFPIFCLFRSQMVLQLINWDIETSHELHMFLLFSLFWSLSLLITLVMVQFFCSKNPDNYFAYCLGRFLLNLFSFVILIKYADILFMNTDTLIHVIEKKGILDLYSWKEYLHTNHSEWHAWKKSQTIGQ